VLSWTIIRDDGPWDFTIISAMPPNGVLTEKSSNLLGLL